MSGGDKDKSLRKKMLNEGNDLWDLFWYYPHVISYTGLLISTGFDAAKVTGIPTELDPITHAIGYFIQAAIIIPELGAFVGIVLLCVYGNRIEETLLGIIEFDWIGKFGKKPDSE